MSQSRSAVAPALIVLCGCAISMLTFGPRSSIGLFQIPMTQEYGWGRDIFGLAVAIQNLLWGVGQPFAGAVADRFGTVRVLCIGALMYAAGLVVMSLASTPGTLQLGAGVLIGFGLSGCSFNLVLAAFGKLLPDEWRPLAFGAGTAAGSMGQFFFPPIGNILIESVGWHQALVVFGGVLLLVLPLSMALATRPGSGAQAGPSAANQTIRQALTEAFQHRSYVLLVLGFFTCGFQLAFITAHMPAYLKDIQMPAWVGAWTLAIIGLSNAVGSLYAGWLSSRMPKRYILAFIYFARSVVTLAFILLPPSPTTAMLFGVSIGLLWLSTVPPTSSLVMLMFGTKYMAMLYESTGSYIIVWWLSIALGIASALINLPIIERPVLRSEPQPA